MSHSFALCHKNFLSHISRRNFTGVTFIYEKFVHLTVHTSYSLSEGAIKIEDLIALGKKHRMPAIGIADSGNLFCSLEFSKKAAENGIKPIIGCTLLFDAELKSDDKQVLDKIVVIAKNETGFKNLLKLVSFSFIDHDLENQKYISLSLLNEYSTGLIILTAGFEGTVGRLLLENKHKEAEAFLIFLKKIFPDHLYIEVVRRGILEEEKKESYLLEMAYKCNIPLVATNNVFYATKDMYEAHDVLMCIAGSRYLDEENRPKSNKEYYFKSAREMRDLFADIPEAIENTINIAKRCSYLVEQRSPMLPKAFENETEIFIKQANEGLAIKIKKHNIENIETYKKRLDFELSVISKMNFAGYFLIVSDFIKWSKSQNIPVGPGRGSGAGSLIAWCLEITDLDPIKFGLLFERFLNPERISMPDFDIDFCQERRDEVIKYVQNKYGYKRVAQIITFGKLQARAVIRDVGRVLQMPYSQIDKISKMVPFNAVNPVTLDKAILMEPMLRKARNEDEQINRLLTIALKLEGLNRHASTHAAGIVIADRDLDELVPLYKDAKSDMLVVQYSMSYAEIAGLVKFDFLGLKTLTIIAKAASLIHKTKPDFDINNIPLDDPLTYKLLGNGDATGVFQFESSGMRDALRKLKADSIKDLMALGALYRPGPMDNIPVYIACKHGKQSPDYLHPLLEDILKETFGVIIYQEQVLQVAQKLAGYTLGSADLLRKAMGKKIKEEMDAQRELFIQGALKNNVDKDDASKIFDLVAKFAGYGFNRAHAASYAIISYQTAFLKANFPLEFMTSCLNIEINDTDKINLFISDAKSQNIKIYPPDINKSYDYFTIEDEGIRYGLGALKNVGINNMSEILKERSQNGDFTNIFDFAKRVNSKAINKRQFESLIKAGAFDNLLSNRRQLFESLEIIMNYNNLMQKESKTKQISLFGSSFVEIKPAFVEVDNWSDSALLNNEFESFGFYMSNHPLDSYRKLLEINKIKSTEYLKNDLAHGFSAVHLAGVVLQVKSRLSPRGRFLTMLVSDCYGSIEVSVYNDELVANSDNLINSNIPLHIIADVKKDEGGTRLSATKIQKLDDFISGNIKAAKIWLEDSSSIGEVSKILDNFNSGKTKFYISVNVNDNEVELELPKSYGFDPSMSKNIKQVAGVKKFEFV